MVSLFRNIHSEELFSVFRTETDKNEERLFELLKGGYVDARYKRDYEITKTELIILLDRVAKMESIVARIGNAKIVSI